MQRKNLFIFISIYTSNKQTVAGMCAYCATADAQCCNPHLIYVTPTDTVATKNFMFRTLTMSWTRARTVLRASTSGVKLCACNFKLLR